MTMTFLGPSLHSHFSMPFLFTMTTTSTTTTTTTRVLPIAPSPAHKRPAAPAAKIPAPRVYAGNKRSRNASAEELLPSAKKVRARGAFRPMIHPVVMGPRTLRTPLAESRYWLPGNCVIGKRRREESEVGEGLKVRVLAGGRRYFVAVGEEDEELAAAPAVILELDIRHPEPAKSDADAASITTVIQEPARPTMVTKSIDDHAHDDCPTDDEEEVIAAKKPKEKSVFSRIGSLKGFKEAVAKAGSRVKQWKQRKEKEQEEKKKAKAEAEEKKRRHRKCPLSSDESADEADVKKEKYLRTSLTLKPSKKASKTTLKKDIILEEEGEATEVDEKPKKEKPEPEPEPESTMDAEMKDSIIVEVECEMEEVNPEEPSEKSEKEDTEEKETEKKKDGDEEEKPKKKETDTETIKPSEGEEEVDKDAMPISSAASIHSIQDVDMFIDEHDETKSIASVVAAEEMDLDDDDDSKTIRGDDEKAMDSLADSESQSKASSETTDNEKKEPTRNDDTASPTKAEQISEKPETEATTGESKGTNEEKPSIESKGNDDKTECPGTPVPATRRAVLAVLSPPSDVLTPPPTPPLGYTTPKSKDPSHWLSWRTTTPCPVTISVDDQPWDTTPTPSPTGRKSLRRRLSAIFKKTLDDNDTDQFNPLNISRHAYRDSWCRDDDEETECDTSSVRGLPLTLSTPLGIELCAWGGPVDSCLEQLESFRMC